MTNPGDHRKLQNLIEQKILEFFGDPDAGLELRPSHLRELKKRMAQKNRKLTPLSVVAKKYGVR